MNFKKENSEYVLHDEYLQENLFSFKDVKSQSLRIQFFQDILEMSEKATNAFLKSDLEASKKEMINLSILLKSNIDLIHYDQVENSVLKIFKELNFDTFLFKICEFIMNSDSKDKTLIEAIIHLVYFLTDFEKTYFNKRNLIPFLNVIYFERENSLELQKEMIEIYSRILPSQINYDPNYEKFSPIFFEILKSFDDYFLKSQLIESFLDCSKGMKKYFQNLLPYLEYFHQRKRCTEIEIRIIMKLIETDNEIFPILIQNHFIDHILDSISNCKEQINIQIINFYLFILQFDKSLNAYLNYNMICVKYLDSENEDEVICGLNFFLCFLPDCLEFLYEKIGVDLLWAIVSSGMILDSSVNLKMVSLKFFVKLLIDNTNDEMRSCIISSNFCELIETLLLLNEIDSTSLCIDALFILFDMASKDPSFSHVFVQQYQQSNINYLLSNFYDANVQMKALIQKIDQLCKDIPS